VGGVRPEGGRACGSDPVPAHFDTDELFRREADRVVTGLSRLELVDVPFTHLPWSNGPGRMCSAAGDPVHMPRPAQEIRVRIAIVRGVIDGQGVGR
jgi:hypothetical protein